jgi:hypothetical protein
MTASLPAFSVNSCTASSLWGSIVSKTGRRKLEFGPSTSAPVPVLPMVLKIDGFTLTQTAGAACTPMVTVPASFPLALGDIPANQSASAPITILFYRLLQNRPVYGNIPPAVNGGSSTLSIQAGNQAR